MFGVACKRTWSEIILVIHKMRSLGANFLTHRIIKNMSTVFVKLFVTSFVISLRTIHEMKYDGETISVSSSSHSCCVFRLIIIFRQNLVFVKQFSFGFYKSTI